MANDPIDFASVNRERFKKQQESVNQEDIEDDPRRAFRISLNDKNILRMAEKAWQGIQHFNHDPRFHDSPFLYTRDGEIVELQRIQGSAADSTIRLLPANVDRMTGIVGRTSYWFSDPKGQFEKEVFPHPVIVRDMTANPHPPLPRIDRIVAAPVFSPDGAISIQPGYNPATATYYDQSPNTQIPSVSHSPSHDDVLRAIGVVSDLIDEFPFVNEADESHAISLMLNPFVRSMIDGPTPLYMVEAPMQGTGKGLLATVCLLPALNREPLVMIPTSNDEEMRKRIFSIVAGSPEAVVIDNIDKTINSAELATVLTTGMVSDRVLGTSRTQTYQVRNTWIATGNNPTMNADVFRRTIRIRLNANVERPEERQFRKNAALWAKQHRGELIWACLTLVNNWIAQGMPEPTRNGANIGSFEQWARVHGGILEAAGIDGFLGNRQDRDSLSGEEQSIPAFIDAWYEKHGRETVLASDLLLIARTIPQFPLKGYNELGITQSFGKQMEKLRDRIVGVHKVTRGSKSNQGARWSLQPAQLSLDFDPDAVPEF